MIKNPPAWTIEHTKAVCNIKKKNKFIPCLDLPDPTALKVVETDASDLGYGGVLKQMINGNNFVIRYYSGLQKSPMLNYSTITKEMLSIVICITKFQDDLLNQRFLRRIDYKAAKDILEKVVTNLAIKQIFAR